MIKFRIHPKFRRGRGVNLGKCKKCQNYRLFDIFLDILHKMKEKLGQEHVKSGPLSFQGKIETIFPEIPEKMTVFPVLTYFFIRPSLKSGFPT